MTEIEIETEETTFTAKQLARKAGTDPKTLRKFLRSTESPVEPVGQGGRYEFDQEASEKIIAAFKASTGVKTTKLKSETESLVDAVDDAIEELEEAPKPKRKPRAKKTAEPVVIDDAVEELEELTDEEPTADDLEELDDLFEDLDD